jgi:16S rRNA (adenine1518-N6/adenine1519-N6)-dimethyltransferase
MQFRLRKRFGQHFLHDSAVIQFIIGHIISSDTCHVVEIGPGRGALTLPLLAHIGMLTVIEIDRDLARALVDKCNTKHLQVFEEDVLKFDFCGHFSVSKVRLVGNLPYNISTPLLFHLLQHISCIAGMIFMMQKEVVERICADPGSHDYGRLSVMIQAQCRAENLLTIGPEAFTPPPRVESSLIKLTPDPRLQGRITDPLTFSEVVRQAFSQRRKTLRNSLAGLIETAGLEQLGINPASRAENLSVLDYTRIANFINHRRIRKPDCG